MMTFSHKHVLCFIRYESSHNQKVSKVLKGTPRPLWINLACSWSAAAILRQAQGFDGNVIELVGSSIPILALVVNDDVSYFVSFLGLPAAE